MVLKNGIKLWYLKGNRPLLVFTEWLAALAAEKQGEVKRNEIRLYSEEDATFDIFLSFLQITDIDT